MNYFTDGPAKHHVTRTDPGCVVLLRADAGPHIGRDIKVDSADQHLSIARFRDGAFRHLPIALRRHAFRVKDQPPLPI